MRIEVDTKSKYGQFPQRSVVEENGQEIKISYSVNGYEKILNISYEDNNTMVIEINDDFIVKKED